MFRFIEQKEKRAFEQSLHNYLMEVLFDLCFGQRVIPEHDVIDKLLKIIFANKRTSPITYKEKSKLDQNPTLRSALLQLLLQYRYFSYYLLFIVMKYLHVLFRNTDAKEFIEEYFENSKLVLHTDFDLHYFLMCLQCFEVCP